MSDVLLIVGSHAITTVPIAGTFLYIFWPRKEQR